MLFPGARKVTKNSVEAYRLIIHNEYSFSQHKHKQTNSVISQHHIPLLQTMSLKLRLARNVVVRDGCQLATWPSYRGVQIKVN